MAAGNTHNVLTELILDHALAAAVELDADDAEIMWALVSASVMAASGLIPHDDQQRQPGLAFDAVINMATEQRKMFIAQSAKAGPH